MKKLALIILLAIMMAIVVSCQKTPENTVVIDEDTNNIVNNIKYNKADFPNIYQDSYSKNGADVIFDAAMELPASSLQTYEMMYTTFSQNDVNEIIKGLFGNQQMYAHAKVTKSVFESAYVEALSELKEKEDYPDQYENSIEYYQDRVDELEEEIKNAPETDQKIPIDSKLIKIQGQEEYQGRGDLGKKEMAELWIRNAIDDSIEPNNTFMQLINGNQYDDISLHYPDMQEYAPNIKITKDEAITKANDILSRIGVDYIKLSGCATGILCSTDGVYPESFDTQTPQGYILYYTRNIDEIPVTFDIRISSSGNSSESYSIPDMYERITVNVDDSGVTYIRWQSPITILNVLEKSNMVVPFSDVIRIAKSQFSYLYATYDDQQEVNESTDTQAQPLNKVDNGKVISNEIHIQRITLGLMQLPVKFDNNKREMDPVWDFFGYYQTIYDNGTKEMHYENNKSLLTINAINGSVIDRTRGY